MAPASRRPPTSSAASACEVGEGADAAARRSPSTVVARQHRGQPVEVGAGQRAVAADLGDDERRHADVGERPGQLDGCGPSPRSSPARPPAPAGVERRRPPATVRGAAGAPARGRSTRRGADDDPGDAQVEQRSAAVLLGAHAAAGLHAARRRPRGDGGHDVAVGGLARCGPRRGRPRGSSGRRPRRSERAWADRVVAVDRLLAVVALAEAHAAAAAQVDGRVQDASRPAAPTASRCAARLQEPASPAWPDFSGWNWVAHTAPARRRPRPGRRGRRWPRCAPVSLGARRSGRSTPTARPAARRTAGGRRRRACSTASAAASRLRAGGGPHRGARPAPARPGAPRTPRTAAACRRRCRGTAGPTRGRLPRRPAPARCRRSASMHRPNAPTPGSTTPAASAITPGRR